MPQAGQVLAAIAAGLGAALIGGLLPLFAAARLPILDALRPHPIGEHQRAGVLLRTASPVLLVIAALCFLSTASGVVALGVVALLLGLVVALPLIAPLVIRLIAVAISPFVTGAQPGCRSSDPCPEPDCDDHRGARHRRGDRGRGQRAERRGAHGERQLGLPPLRG